METMNNTNTTNLFEGAAWFDTELMYATGLCGALGFLSIVFNALLLRVLAQKQLLKENKVFWLLMSISAGDFIFGFGCFPNITRKLLAILYPAVVPKRIILEMIIYDFLAVVGETMQQLSTLFVALDRVYAVFCFRRYAAGSATSKTGQYMFAFVLSLSVIEGCLGLIDINHNLLSVDPFNVQGPVIFMSYIFPSTFVLVHAWLQMALCYTTTVMYLILLLTFAARVVNIKRYSSCFNQALCTVIELQSRGPSDQSEQPNTSLVKVQQARNRRIMTLLIWLMTVYVFTVTVSNVASSVASSFSLEAMIRFGFWSLVLKLSTTATNFFIHVWSNKDIRVALVTRYPALQWLTGK